jgi:hypothetical protein
MAGFEGNASGFLLPTSNLMMLFPLSECTCNSQSRSVEAGRGDWWCAVSSYSPWRQQPQAAGLSTSRFFEGSDRGRQVYESRDGEKTPGELLECSTSAKSPRKPRHHAVLLPPFTKRSDVQSQIRMRDFSFTWMQVSGKKSLTSPARPPFSHQQKIPYFPVETPTKISRFFLHRNPRGVGQGTRSNRPVDRD